MTLGIAEPATLALATAATARAAAVVIVVASARAITPIVVVIVVPRRARHAALFPAAARRLGVTRGIAEPAALDSSTAARAATVVVVIASDGYPASPRTGDPITGLDAAAEVPGVVVLHAGTRRDDSGALVSAGGRVLNVVAVGSDLGKARSAAYDAVSVVELHGSHHRRDIALRAELGEITV